MRSAAVRPLIVVALLAVLVLAPLASGTTLRATTATAGPAPVTRALPPVKGHPALHIGTYNIRSGTSLATFRRGVKALRRHVDVAGLQEIGLNAKRRYLATSRTWGSYHAPKIQQNPVIWNRRDFEFLGGRGPWLAPTRRLGRELPGSGQPVKKSYASVVHLRHRASGRRISVVNVHLVHGAVRAGRPWPGRPRTFRLFRAQVAGLVRVVRAERSWGKVFVLGDFNVGYAQDKREGRARLPFRQLTHLGLRSIWKGSRYVGARHGTHRNALLDQVWSRTRPRHRSIVRTIRASDHYPAVATYRLHRARR